MITKNLDYIEDKTIEYKKSSNIYIGATFVIMVTLIAIGMIFG
jgi:hypothetical protein